MLGDAQAVPLGAQAVDAVLTAFTLRNVPDIDVVLAECHRVLRPGGRLAVLELTPVRTPLFGPLFRFYFHRLVPLLGGLVSGRGDAYRYLPQSVRALPGRRAPAGDAPRGRLRPGGLPQARGGHRRPPRRHQGPRAARSARAPDGVQRTPAGLGAPPPPVAPGGGGRSPHTEKMTHPVTT